MQKTYTNIQSIQGPLLVVEGVDGVTYEELVDVTDQTGRVRRGRVLEVHKSRALVQMFEATQGMSTTGLKAKFLGQTMKLGVSMDMLGRVFNGAGQPLDGGPNIIPEKQVDINGAAINPYSRKMPKQPIITGVSSIDVQNTLVRGQKLPVFSGAGLPHADIAAQIARQAYVPDDGGEKVEFAIVFGAMGVTFEEAMFFQKEFESTGAIDRAALFLNTAADPVVERITVPRLALSFAEYLAFEKDMHVLVILTDMTNYAEALREVSAARKEVPGRRGYPGYLYTDLATIYERAGLIQGKKGSVTQVPILSMPEDDVTHPVPDLTGYITEGQLRLDRAYHAKKLSPPITPMGSLSRLAKEVQGKRTRKDHGKVAGQIAACYAKGVEMRELSAVLGESSLSDMDKTYLRFADAYENTFVNQGYETFRTLEESLDLSWELMRMFPKSELKRISPDVLDEYY
ncbi:V-type ATP synthase subunit B [Candidatus Peribacteria bacterium]|nr:V-type ATP synthase subunit B [Candidatus Peribacteria bacterium]